MARPKTSDLPAGIRKRKTASAPYFVYEINFLDGEKQRFERVGTDLREARRRLAERKRDVATGSYKPGEGAKDKTLVRELAAQWLDDREGDVITIKLDRTRFRMHILPVLGELRVSEVEASHIVQLISKLQKKTSKRYKKPLAANTIRTIYGNVVTFFADAEQQGYTLRSPCAGVRKSQRPRKGTRAETQGVAYTAEQASMLIFDERIPLDRRVFYALLFFTGARFGEAAGYRWKDYDDPKRKPLGHLRLERQYDNLPLKGKRGQPGQPRDIPVHTTLAAMLDEWRTRGFPALFGRHAEPSDFIVPSQAEHCRTLRACAYWMKRDCALVGFHAKEATHVGRRTFITLAMASGAAEAWVKRITHNASGDVLSGYTVNDWPAMCGVVSRIPIAPVNLAEVIALPVLQQGQGVR